MSPPSLRYSIRAGILEITQIGKECHTACAIRRQVGKCIMSEERGFARVIRGGLVRAGHKIRSMGKNGR